MGKTSSSKIKRGTMKEYLEGELKFLEMIEIDKSSKERLQAIRGRISFVKKQLDDASYTSDTKHVEGEE